MKPNAWLFFVALGGLVGMALYLSSNPSESPATPPPSRISSPVALPAIAQPTPLLTPNGPLGTAWSPSASSPASIGAASSTRALPLQGMQAMPSIERVSVSSEHEQLLARSKPLGREQSPHDILETEKRDSSWINTVEPGLARYFQAVGINSGFVLQQVECRTTLCEVQATSAPGVSREQIDEFIASMKSESVGDQVGRWTVLTAPTAGGGTAFVLYLSRSPR